MVEMFYCVLFTCTAFNLILCYHAIGDQEKLKRGFQRLLKVQQNGEDDEDRYYPTVVSSTGVLLCSDVHICYVCMYVCLESVLVVEFSSSKLLIECQFNHKSVQISEYIQHISL